VGVWGDGPFENDDAVDFAAELDNADPVQRELLIREALQAVVDADADEGISFSDAARAVAAAAVVAATRTGRGIEPGEGPTFLEVADQVEPLPDDLADLARDAMERVIDEDSPWRAWWEGSAALD
jgi:hypothetical protein